MPCAKATCDCTSAKSDGIVVTDENMAEVEASWNALGDVGVVSADDFFYDYVNSDADAVPMDEPTDDAIVADVTRQTDPSDDEDAVVSHAHTFDVPTLPQALDAVDLVRRFMASTDTSSRDLVQLVVDSARAATVSTTAQVGQPIPQLRHLALRADSAEQSARHCVLLPGRSFGQSTVGWTPSADAMHRPVSKLLFHQPNAGWNPCVAPAEVPDDDTISHSPGAVSCCIPRNQLCCPGRALGGPVCCQNTCPAGHTADCCTADSIADVVATLYDAKSCGDVAMLLLLDVESAFDGLLHTVIEAAMDRLGISGYLHGFVTAFLTGRTFRVRVGRQLSEPRDIRVMNICGSQRC
ncbi:hypothetical protein HPB49_008542 [Dermacentor silvarum]|uniref:Uncharacterized protein n=1 Tax=Dermacentor silvarum TaxID=543639 RepID=A0ACB8CE69_DERSI|nr:hypothetical protein HPB49_008542 [Dermacentor silvarum]